MREDPPASIIKKLPIHLANQIAAGEVVQRPESVVKELVENAIDAGAEHISVIISDAGKTMIQVIDDGCGILEDDALLAFERHATSKIQTYQDLERIVTLGFRGEALPSIASVSKVELKTRTKGNELAAFIRIEGGRLDEQSKVQAPVGTSVTVKNLFYNTPARRQFLKADTTEYRHIADTIQRYILSYPNIRITFISNNETIFDAHPGDLRSRVRYLFGDRVEESLIEVHEDTELITITGFLGRPQSSKKTRGEQFLFINGRYVISRYLNHAIINAYDSIIEHGEYPMYVLFLNINPEEIDVNVHPSKLEVKFSNERNIYTILSAVIRQSLYKYDLSPSIIFDELSTHSDVHARLRFPSETEQGPTAPKYGSSIDSRGGVNLERPIPGQRIKQEDVDEVFRSMGVFPDTISALESEDSAIKHDSGEQIVLLPSEKPVSDTQFLWQLHNKYIFTPIKSGLMIIDQHVAHERILYEKALSALEHAAPFSQQLLFPHSFTVTPSDFVLLQEISEELRHLGFVINLQKSNTVTVEAVPQDVNVGMEEKILEEILEQYKEYQASGITEIRHNVAASYACRTAIKSGAKLSAQEIQTLIDQLFATSNPYICPHGRPIVIRLSLEELDKRFGRTG